MNGTIIYNNFLKGSLNIKNKHFLKYQEQFKRIVPQMPFLQKSQPDFEEILEKLFQKFSLFLSTKTNDLKQFDLITKLYKPPSNFSKNHRNLFFTTFDESNDLMARTKNLIFEKARALHNIPEIQFLKNGKSPMNFITGILVSILRVLPLNLYLSHCFFSFSSCH